MDANLIMAIIGSSALFSFVQYLITRHDNKKNTSYALKSDIAPIQAACMAIIQDRLEYLMTKYLKEGQITSTQFKAVNTLLSAYEGLGGNDYIHGLYEQVKELPIK